MDRTLGLFIIGLVFGGCIGFAIAAANGVTFDGHDHDDPAHHAGMDHTAMGHGGADHAAIHETLLEVEGVPAPRLAIHLTPDPVAGYNLHLTVEDFTFAPQSTGLGDTPGEGHAHVYVNGAKLARIYGPWFHIDALPPGEVEVAVTLNSNDHRPLASAGEPITASTKVTVE
jgi:hypothetical protein